MTYFVAVPVEMTLATSCMHLLPRLSRRDKRFPTLYYPHQLIHYPEFLNPTQCYILSFTASRNTLRHVFSSKANPEAPEHVKTDTQEYSLAAGYKK
jgi:hypothetical protein